MGGVREQLEEQLRALFARASAELTPEEAQDFRAVALELCETLAMPPAGEASSVPAEPSVPCTYGIIGDSEPMQHTFTLLERVTQSDYPVLVTGESGTGKELVARALHFHGKRKGKPFLSENCAAIPETLLESILFGHAKGAFTGAHKDNPGHFVAAHTGTLFLDEIGDMPLSMQSKLLRVLQDGEVRPVGSDKTRKVDVRIVAATNKDLKVCVEQKTFRQDLFYRLNVLEIHLPPLRERGDDVLHIAEFFLWRAHKDLGRSLELGASARRVLLEHAWPGNVRQLENEIRRAAALSGGGVLEASDFTLE